MTAAVSDPPFVADEPLSIHPAEPIDAGELCRLGALLGAMPDVRATALRLAAIARRDDHVVLVARDAADRAIAWVDAHIVPVPDGASFVEVLRLVVDPAHRNRGVATTLLAAVELWARDVAISDRRVRGDDAHPDELAFFRRRGYRESWPTVARTG